MGRMMGVLPRNLSPRAAHREVLLDIKDVYRTVHTRRRTVEILRGMSMTAHAGEVTALLGPNGAGKTTTLNMAQGLDLPDQGHVRLLGEDPWRAGAELRSRVGVMLQDGGLPPSATPQRLLNHIASLYRHPQDIRALSSRLGIDDFADRSIRRLSGGQRQRVALAAALTGRPSIVFLDEPSAGLDPVSRQIVFDLILELKQAGLAIVLTTHLLDDAQRLADQVYLMNAGAVQRFGSVAELTAGTENTPLSFSTDRPLSEAEMADIPAGISLTQRERPAYRSGVPHLDDVHHYEVAGLNSPEELMRLAGWWNAHQLMPLDLSMARRSLEDVFWEVSP